MRTGRPARSSSRWLVAVGGAWSLVQLLAIGRVDLGWDETVYTSQVGSLVPAAHFSAPRARGISWLVAPVAAVTTNPMAIRGFLAVLSGVALVVAYWPWLRLHRGVIVPLAAGLFATLWVAVFYGPAVMPNIWVALAAVAATGWFLRAGRRPSATGPLVATAVAVSVATLMRPVDAVFVTLPLLVAVVVVPAWRDWRRLLAIGGGLAAGALPWVVEAITSYGGVLARLRAGSRVEGGMSLQWSVGTALSSVDGPGLCRPCLRPVPTTGLLLWVGGLIAVGVACWLAWRAGTPGGILLPTVVGFGAAFPYLFLIDYSAPRFLLPAYALLVLPVAAALVACWRTPARAMVVVIVAGLVIYQVGVLAAIVRGSDRQRTAWRQVTAALSANQVRPQCTLTGVAAVPLAFYGGCASAQLSGPDRSTTVTELLARSQTQRVAVITRGVTLPPAWARRWHPVTVLTASGTWRVFVAPTPSASSPGALPTGWSQRPSGHRHWVQPVVSLS